MKNKRNFLLIVLFILFNFQNIYSTKILVFSIPKCGTHLITKSIELLTSKKLTGEIRPKQILEKGLPKITDPNKFFRCHLPYDRKIEEALKKQNFKTFFIYRDPRDQVVSRAYWIQKRLKASLHTEFNWQNAQSKKSTPDESTMFPIQFNHITLEELNNYLDVRWSDEMVVNQLQRRLSPPANKKIPSISQLIDFLIEDIDKYYAKYMPWANSKSVCTLKFESLIGTQGHGNNYLQRTELRKICNYLKIDKHHLIDYCMQHLFGGTFTFREGKIGSWKKHFTPNQKQEFKLKGGSVLIKLGYEKDFRW